MARKSLTRVLLASLTAVIGLGTVPACSVAVPAYGCSDRDEKFASALPKLDIFQAHPNHVVELESYSGCDADDGFAYAGTKYLVPLNRNELLDFYRVAAKEDDWRFDGDRASPAVDHALVTSAGGSCYSKEIDGTTAYLRVWFPGDLGDTAAAAAPSAATGTSSQSVYGVEITASHDGEAWC
jgi:hypothetical protein